jgi:serine/threonine protein kinase/tetratricopeptide (TPR) repeat protein
MPVAPGSHLGPYEILSPLGKGGMGEVWRARDPRLGRDVAIKVLPVDVAGRADRLSRFEREARSVATLNHPNIVTLHSIEEAGGTHFLTMELVEGEPLDRLVAPGGLPLARVLELALPLADALAAAHDKGVVHRDLKPANVMVTKDGRLKVLDFGLAKLAAAEAGPDATVAPTMESPISTIGQVMGTVPYMAPEQIRGEEVDARTDLFAFGVVLYELATGRRPFGGATGADISSAILRDVPAPPTEVRPDLPGDLDRIVGRCLEKDPRERFQRALDVRLDLRALQRTLERTASRAKATAKPAPADGASIAVLPFVNRSREADDEYFSDGLADELLNVLAKIRGLRVAARTSSFHFKGKDPTIAEVGSALNVKAVLEGSVRKAGNRVRITVQLVNVADGFHLWSETYDRTLEDIFAVQDDIAQSVVKELRSTLLGEEPDSEVSGEVRAEVAQAAKGRSADPEAHRLFLHGRHLAERLTVEGLKTGVAYLKQALERDPDYALAWAALSRATALEAALGSATVPEGNERAREAALKALALEPDLAEGHLALGQIQMWYDWDWKAAEASLKRALALAPGNVEAWDLSGLLAYDFGRLDEAIELEQRAVGLDPLSVGAHLNLGRCFRAADRLPEAERELRRARELSSGSAAGSLILASVLGAQGRVDEALAIMQSEERDWSRLCGLAILQHAAGRVAESDAALKELIAKRSGDAAYQIALAHAARGEHDATFEWLERAYEQRDSGLAILKLEPFFRPLHPDPRWGALVARMGLAD